MKSNNIGLMNNLSGTKVLAILAVGFATYFGTGATKVFAGSQLTKVDLDIESTEIVKADTDILGWYYYIDKAACICWVGGKSSIEAGPSVFDCSKLKAHAPLREHLKACVPGLETASETKKEKAAAEEPKSEESKK